MLHFKYTIYITYYAHIIIAPNIFCVVNTRIQHMVFTHNNFFYLIYMFYLILYTSYKHSTFYKVHCKNECSNKWKMKKNKIGISFFYFPFSKTSLCCFMTSKFLVVVPEWWYGLSYSLANALTKHMSWHSL